MGKESKGGQSSGFKIVVGVLLLSGLGIGLGQGWSGYLHRQEFLRVPIKTLEARQDQTKLMGVPLDGERLEADELGRIEFLDSMAFAQGSNFDPESLEPAREMLADASVLDRLKEFARAPLDTRMPTAAAMQTKERYIAVKRAAGSLNRYGTAMVAEGNFDEALRCLDLMVALQGAVARFPSENGITQWFGINLNVLKLVDQVRLAPGVTDGQRQRLLGFVRSDLEMARMRNHVAYVVQGMAALSRDVKELDESAQSQLIFAAETDEFPPLTERGIEKAMESTVLELGLKLLNLCIDDDAPEMLGVDLDQILFERKKSREYEPSEFMVFAFPHNFELMGRMVQRIAQARGVMQVVLSEEFEEGEQSLMVGGVQVRIQTRKADGGWELLSPAISGDAFMDLRKPELVVSQTLGVGAFVAD